ncbi:acyl-CoA dehydrogenase family protein [Amycolatopsis acidiphila]|uniref:Acyl-[acyl-carrier-protein] dehydrogenase MbtN n=1 Tax=Amycolatopsis acidiphila TaxID=715473 RepID=A0A558AH95_9PSEU|nr:acyl-CoA dehydrogenase family protein [Amycolatopsis acidiphila]TVT23644.1 acyl-CoA dehydrogenase [Amycolatopsis acidiphila]UIJ58633.1 acyl-CoA dehydrogenase family protein [Amycolatopsis acidiphila]
MAELSSSGAVRQLYGETPRGNLDPLVLRRLIGRACQDGRLGPVLALSVQLATALPLLAESAVTPCAREVLDACLAGEEVVAVAATDETAGSDLVGAKSAVALEGTEKLVLRGRKRWVTSALFARHALVLAKHRPGRHFTNFTWFLVPLAAAGVSVSPVDTTLFEGAGLGHLTFDGVEIAPEWVLGGFGRGLAMFSRHITVERLASATWAIHLCHTVISRTVRRLDDRQVDDLPLSRNPAVRQRLAGCLVQLHGLNALWERLRERIAVEHDAVAGALLKAASAATVDQVMTACSQFHGADGFRSGGVQQMRAEAAVFGIGGGATELMLDVVADHLPALLKELES